MTFKSYLRCVTPQPSKPAKPGCTKRNLAAKKEEITADEDVRLGIGILVKNICIVAVLIHQTIPRDV